MNDDNQPFEIHVHGDVKLNPDADFGAVQAALKPLWAYAGATSLAEGAGSLYEEEPGLLLDRRQHLLQMCWTVRGGNDFRQQLDDLCMNLNEVSANGATIEATFYDAQFDEDDQAAGRQSRDDFVLLFVGPSPEAIMQAQRDLLVDDVEQLMERHFDRNELDGVVAEIDRLFAERFNELVSSLQIGRPPDLGGGPGAGGHGGQGRRRHLH